MGGSIISRKLTDGLLYLVGMHLGTTHSTFTALSQNRAHAYRWAHEALSPKVLVFLVLLCRALTDASPVGVDLIAITTSGRTLGQATRSILLI